MESRKPAYVRSEIHGLRAIAVLMVVAYHVWLGRVSGGVDVFLFLTGFLITGTLLRATAAQGRPFGGAFFSRLASRLLPPVVVVIIGTLVATYLFMPRHRWTGTFQESLASLLYVENWVLATNSVDYLAQDDPPSLLQHFWSLSMQGQFYPLWFGLFLVGALLARRYGWRMKRIVLVGASLVFVLSFTYSLWRTATDQPWAYFDTGARLWQFAVGALLFLVIDQIKLSVRARIALGWVGLIALVSLGALVDVSRLFPGWVAVVPMAAAGAIVIAGETRAKSSVDYMLAWRPVTKLSDWSYALYLWHWPVLLVYLQVRGYDSVGLRGGVAIFAVSILLAGITTEALKRRPWRLPRSATSVAPAFRYAAIWTVPVLVVTGVGGLVFDQRDQQQASMSRDLAQDVAQYPGALALIDPGVFPVPTGVDFIPPLEALPDLPVTRTLEEECYPRPGNGEAYRCTVGDSAGELTIALVGASRIDHYVDAFDAAGKQQGWRIDVMTKSGCHYSAFESENEGDEEACYAWNDGVQKSLEAERPDLVVMLGTTEHANGEERTYPGFVARYRELEELGVRVLALRDLPRRAQPLPECLAERGVDGCRLTVTDTRKNDDPVSFYGEIPDSVTWFDFLPYVCPDGSCPAVVGNVLTYYDHSHLTATYATTLAPVATEAVQVALGISDK